ncbi:MAG: PadR family transcriptional regulator [Thaumarchaeota archaeon]|nr:PadR family transcriptional regulator [Nitrososphaerota archaeon]
MNTAEEAKIQSFLRRYRRGLVNSLLEFLILSSVERSDLCGYDILTLIYDRFHILLSPGQIYPVIDYLAEHGLVSKQPQGKRTLLRLSTLGASLLRTWRYELSSLQLEFNKLVVSEA